MDSIKQYFHYFNDKEKLNNLIISLSNNLLDEKSSRISGNLIVYQIVKLSGTFDDYLENFKDILEPNTFSFINTHLTRLNQVLKDYNEYNYKYDLAAIKTMTELYLLKRSYDKDPLESPVQHYLRCAIFLFLEDGIERVLEVFDVLVKLKISLPTPARMHCGIIKSQLTSCFLVTVDNTKKDILETGFNDMPMIGSLKGGLGAGLSKLSHSKLISNKGESQGIGPFARILERILSYTDLNKNRRSAANINLHDWHIDLEEFIHLSNKNNKEKDDILNKIDTTILLSPLFMKRVKENKEWTMMCPSRVDLYNNYLETFEEKYLEAESRIEKEKDIYTSLENECEKLKRKVLTESTSKGILESDYKKALKALDDFEKTRIVYKKENALKLFNKMIYSQMVSGRPYLLSSDAINSKNGQSNEGNVNSSNLCVEIMEVSKPGEIASCNLCSISLKKFIKRKKLNTFKAEKYNNISHLKYALYHSGLLDIDDYKKCCKMSVDIVNKMIDKNFYPVQHKTQPLNLKMRPLGIGVSGFDDAVKKCDFIFDSKEGDELNKILFSLLYYWTLERSVEMSEKDGSYTAFKEGSFRLETTEENVEGSLSKEIKTLKNRNSIYTHTFEGSPFSNGFLQFDLWRHRSLVLEAKGELNISIYNKDDDIPVSIPEIGVEWSNLKKNIKEKGIRNSMLTTCMPTASTAHILNNSESTEVYTSNLFTRELSSGIFIIKNSHLIKDFKNIGLYNQHLIDYLQLNEGSIKDIDKYYENYKGISSSTKDLYNIHKDRVKFLIEKYKGMFEISQKNIIMKARQRGIYIDQSQSLNIFLNKVSEGMIRNVHFYSYDLGLKTLVYYLRQKGNLKNSAGLSVNADLLEYFESTKLIEKTSEKVSSEISKEVSSEISKEVSSECLGDSCLMCGS